MTAQYKAMSADKQAKIDQLTARIDELLAQLGTHISLIHIHAHLHTRDDMGVGTTWTTNYPCDTLDLMADLISSYTSYTLIPSVASLY